MENKWIIAGTWTFSERHMPKGVAVLKNNGSAIDAAVEMIKGIEADPKVDSVGFGALPAWDGEVDADSAIMDGNTMEIGAVGNLKGFLHPIEVAKDVLVRTKHDILVGPGAADFAARFGNEQGSLLTEKATARWKELMAEQDARPDSFDNIKRHGEQGKIIGHDTVGVVARDADGHFVAATSTSGLALKLPGRVGDSPICGAGLYADDRRGAAAATGVGEDIIRCALCFRIVDKMGKGIPAQQACEQAVQEACKELVAADRVPGEMAVVALDTNGNCGYAANHSSFYVAVASEHKDIELIHADSCTADNYRSVTVYEAAF